jgi:hypothetical protein
MRGLDDSCHDEGETVKDGIHVQPIEKFGRTIGLALRWQGSEQYCDVEVDADLRNVVSQIDTDIVDCKASRLTPIPEG